MTDENDFDEDELEDRARRLDDLRDDLETDDEVRRIRWEQVVWTCPSCGQTGLDPRGTPHKPAGWQFDDDISVEDVEDEKVVECIDCETVFDIELIPRGAQTGTGTCPECGSGLQQGGEYGGRLVCDDCGREYEIREISWMEQVDD